MLLIKAEAVEGIKRRGLLSEVGALGSAPPAPRRSRDWSSSSSYWTQWMLRTDGESQLTALEAEG